MGDGDAFRQSRGPRGGDQIDRVAGPDPRRHHGIDRGVQQRRRVDDPALRRQLVGLWRLRGQDQADLQLSGDIAQHGFRHGRVQMHEGAPVDHAGRHRRAKERAGRAINRHRLLPVKHPLRRRDERGQIAIAQRKLAVAQRDAVAVCDQRLGKLVGDRPVMIRHEATRPLTLRKVDARGRRIGARGQDRMEPSAGEETGCCHGSRWPIKAYGSPDPSR